MIVLKIRSMRLHQCVSHTILIRKYYTYNFHQKSCKLTSSYLKIDNNKSDLIVKLPTKADE